MNEFAHGAMLIGALVGAGCAATTRGTVLDLASSAVMLAAMVDMAFTQALPPLVWTTVLVGIGLALGARLRAARGAQRVRASAAGRPLHRALAFIVGGWAFAMPASDAVGATHAHGGGIAFLAASSAMIVFGGCLVVRELRTAGRPRLRHAAEAASTSLMLAAMAVPGLVAALV